MSGTLPWSVHECYRRVCCDSRTCEPHLRECHYVQDERPRSPRRDRRPAVPGGGELAGRGRRRRLSRATLDRFDA